MNKYILLVILLVPVYSVSQTHFEKDLTNGSSTNSITQVYQLSDQSYFVFDNDYWTYGGSPCSLQYFSSFDHINDSGNTLNRINEIGIINQDKINALEYDSVGCHLKKIDASGNLLSRVLLDDSMEYHILKPTVDHNLIAFTKSIYYGNTFPHLDYSYIQKIDTSGSIFISKLLSIDSSSNLYWYSIYPTADSGFYLIKETPIWNNNEFIVVNRIATKYNSLLDSIFSKQMNPDGLIYQARNLDLILYNADQTGMKNIAWFNSNLDTSASRSFNDSMVWNQPYELNNGDWVFFHTTGSGVAFAREDSNANLVWNRQMYPVDSSAFTPETVIQTSDGGFLIGGYHDCYTGPITHCLPLYSTSVIIKTDSAGISFSINGIGEINSYDNRISIYPNPFTFSTSINIENFNGEKILNFELFNALGMEVKTFMLNGSKSQFNRADLSSGIYFYKITDAKNIIKTGKLIIE